MEIRFAPLDLAKIDGLRYEAAALACFSDERPLRGAAGLCDWRLCGAISRVVATGRVTGELGEVLMIPVRPRLPFDKLLLFGLGARAGFDRACFHRVATHMLDALDKLRLRTFVVALPGRGTGELAPGDAIRWFLAAAEGRAFDEVVVLDELEAHKAMTPVVDAERRRARAAREVARDA